MSSPFATYPAPERSFIPNATRPAVATPVRGAGSKRGRKPRGPLPPGTTESTRTPITSPTINQPTPVQWPNAQTNLGTAGAIGASTSTFSVATSPTEQSSPVVASSPQTQMQTSETVNTQLSSEASTVLALPGMVSEPGAAGVRVDAPVVVVVPGPEEDADGDDEMLPAMADDDYSAQLSFQSQSKDNLKVLMDNFTPGQYDRFEAYRRHALSKQAVRKVIQQTLGQQVSQPVAQIVAGFSKVFVGEIVEKAREVQTRRGEMGPLSPDHLREAYRMYQKETGRVGAARPLKGKRIFMR